jgi:SAM-dependent methyltransferase
MTERLDAYSTGNSDQEIALSDSFTLDRYAQFSRHLPPGVVKVLDVGCAEGRGGAHLKGLVPGIKLAGLDCVAERLESLPDAYESKVHGLTHQIPVADLTYDAVVAGEFLEHLYPSDVDPTLCEFQRILKIGGRLLLTTPNPNSIKMRVRGGSVFGVAHLTQHFPRLLRHRLMLHGFSRVRLIGSGKAIRHFGERFPLLSIYGSYLVVADKR